MSSKKAINIQTKMPPELKLAAEKGAQRAGFRTLQDAFYFFASSLAHGEFTPSVVPSYLYGRKDYIEHLETDFVEAEKELTSGKLKSVRVSDSVDETLEKLNAEDEDYSN